LGRRYPWPLKKSSKTHRIGRILTGITDHDRGTCKNKRGPTDLKNVTNQNGRASITSGLRI
jgi:hypothetical protein